MQKYEFDKKTFMEELISIKDFRLHVLFVHLHIEFWMNNIIEIKFSHPKTIMHNKDFKTFSNKLELLYAMDVINENIYQQIKAVNRIRNHYAHNITLNKDFPSEVKKYIDELCALNKGDFIDKCIKLEHKFITASSYLVGYLNGLYEKMLKPVE
ncbi:MAG: hypothetical protein HZB67_04305 [Candidatus Aenigmarchaeota archaeon]|nr:hypothetical protein [Candidatus Aenigmarchaeota archaeon]